MLDEPFRARFASVSRPMTEWLTRVGITATQLTVAAGGLGVAAAVLVAIGHSYLAMAVWLTGRLADGLDGAVARASTTTSPFGAFLDITLDMTAYVAMVLGFAVAYPDSSHAWPWILSGYVLVITSTLGLSDAAHRDQQKVSSTDRTFQFTPGLVEAGETNVMYVLWALFPEHLPWLTWVWAAALLVTTAQRVLRASRLLR